MPREPFTSIAIKRACLSGTDQDLNWELMPKFHELKETIRKATEELIDVEAAIGENRIKYKEIYDTEVIEPVEEE